LPPKVGTIAGEVADERNWRTLPGFFSVARVKLPPGTHTVSLPTPGGLQSRQIQVSGAYALISLRTSGPSVYLAQTPYNAEQAALALAAPEPAPLQTAAKGKAKARKGTPNQAGAAAAASNSC